MPGAPTTAPILKHLDAIAGRGHSFNNVFEDWLALMCNAYTQNETDYQAIVAKYPNTAPHSEREVDHFAFALAELWKAQQTEFRDYLGQIFEERVSNWNRSKGQYFTPEHLAELMAQITMQDIQPGQRVADQCCGSGRMLIAATRINREGYFFGTDLDMNCTRMAAINLLHRNVNGAVLWGDTLALKSWGGYELRQTMKGGEMTWIGPNRAQELIEGPLRQQMAETPRPPSPKPQEAKGEADDDEETVKPPQLSLAL